MGWIADRFSKWRAGRRERREITERVAANDARRRELLANLDLTPLERLLRWWGEPESPGIDDKPLSDLERRYDVRLPKDFRAYLKAAMPAGNVWDDEGTRWWPLDEIKSVREECGSQAGYCPDEGDDRRLVFADFLIWCHAWAIDCSDGPDRGKVRILAGIDRNVADSFDDFLDRYMRDDHSVYRYDQTKGERYE